MSSAALDIVQSVHSIGSRVLVAVAVALAVLGTYQYIRNRFLPEIFRTTYLLLFGLTALQGLLGIIAFLLGGRPTELLHIAYGVFALIFLPGAYFSSKPSPHRNETLILTIAAWIVAVVYIRGIVTG